MSVANMCEQEDILRLNVSNFAGLSSAERITRFAPSPTGYLHLGHVAAAIFVWGLGRALQSKIFLRIEDHDLTRCRPEYEEAIIHDLNWLGFTPDHDDFSLVNSRSRSPSSFRQSDQYELYRERLRQLINQNLIYACDCSRKQLAHNAETNELHYSGKCRERGLALDQNDVGLRLRTPDHTVHFCDALLGPMSQTPQQQCGDLLLRDRHNCFTYQFAVVMDDLRHGVNLVIRGQDILNSTARQLLLGRFFDPAFSPVYFHHPLIDDDKGRKLSKRFFAEAIAKRRTGGEQPEKIIGEAAFHVGLLPKPAAISVQDIIALFKEMLAHG